MKFSSSLLALSAFTSEVVGLSAASWRDQSIYQVITDRFALTNGSTSVACDALYGLYCGGTWEGITNHLDYIQNMGFTAIWISPVVANIEGNSNDGSAYHGYWAQNIYEVNSHFGDAASLKALSDALHDRGMYLMVDVVANHMGYLGASTAVDYSEYTPFNSEADYHTPCFIDYDDPTSVIDCWEGDDVVALPDLRTEVASIAAVWNDWITALVANYSIDGLRVDSAQQTGTFFFPDFRTAAGVYMTGEILNGDPTYVCPYQEVMDGPLNYPVYFWVIAAFKTTTGSMSDLVNGVAEMISDCLDPTLMASFMENHDEPRFPFYTSDISLTKNAMAFTIFADGIPIIYQGQEQHYSGGATPLQREAIWLSDYSTTSTFYEYIAQLNAIRNHAIYADSSYTSYKNYPVYSDASTIVMRKGLTGAQVISIFTNGGASAASSSLSLTSAETGYTANEQLVEVLGCTAVTADASGGVTVTIAGGLPMILYPLSRLIGSGICTAITTTTALPIATLTPCATPSSVAITFLSHTTTVTGQTIKLVSDTTNWDVASGYTLSASSYTVADPLWETTINLAAGTTINYKYVNVAADGTATWEGGDNRVFVIPGGCASAASVSSVWQS